MTDLIVDGLIFELQPLGGIARMFREFLPTACALDSQLRVTLLYGDELHDPPSHPQITTQILEPAARQRIARLFGRKGQGGSRFAVPIGDLSGVWHSTYYTISMNPVAPSVCTVHDMIYEKLPEYFRSARDDEFRNIKRTAINQSQAVVCISNATKADVIHYYSLRDEEITVIPHAVAKEFRKLSPRELERAKVRRPFLLFVGARSIYKNAWGMIEAYAKWHGSRDLNLLLISHPWEADELHRLDALGVQGKVHAKDNVSDTELCILYNQAAALIVPSEYEGFGFPLAEAMACGCPVVSSRIPSSLEVAGDAAVYFEVASVESFCIALDQALNDGRSHTRIELGLTRATGRTWSDVAREYMDLYRLVATD